MNTQPSTSLNPVFASCGGLLPSRSSHSQAAGSEETGVHGLHSGLLLQVPLEVSFMAPFRDTQDTLHAHHKPPFPT